MSNLTVYLSLGGNLSDPVNRLNQALEELKSSPFIHCFQASSFYRTSPVEVETTSDFINAVCCFQTTLSLKALFDFTQEIEKKLGKEPKPKNASRPIDIDILFYGAYSYHTDQLTIPHPRWIKRLFVLYPLYELISKITLKNENNFITYNLKNLIEDLKKESFQLVCLLNENPFVNEQLMRV